MRRTARLASLLSVLALCAAAPAGAGEPSSRLFVVVRSAELGEAVSDVTEAPGGDLLLARGDFSGSSIVRLSPDGAASTVFQYRRDGTLGPTGPLGVLAAPDGSLLVADGARARIVRLRPDGTSEVVAGTGERGFAGDGGPATAALLDIGSFTDVPGLALAGNGDLLLTDAGNARVRRVRSDGTIETVAGSGFPFDPGRFRSMGDGGPATAAQLLGPTDLLAMPDGGFLVSDGLGPSVRRVRPDGVIVRIAGRTDGSRGPGTGDDGPALDAGIGAPTGLARAPDGALLIGESATRRVRRLAADGTKSTVVDLAPTTRGRVGDFAGRVPPAMLSGLGVTAEDGVAMAAGHLYYRAPRATARTLVALRDARVSPRRVLVTFDATQAGTVRLRVRRLGRLIASAGPARVRAGRHTLGVTGRFAPREHDVSIELVGPGGATAYDAVPLLTSRVLREDTRLLARIQNAAEGLASDTAAVDRCRRMTARRLDCNVIDQDVDDRCAGVLAIVLRRSGALFSRPYVCRSRGPVFRLRPAWIEPATALP